MNKWVLDEHCKSAIQERVGWFTILIDVAHSTSKTPAWGTGSLISVGKRKFILTCRHVIDERFKNEDLRFLYRSDKTLGWAPKDEIKKRPLSSLDAKYAKTYPQQLPIIDRFCSDRIDDLLLLELDTLSKEIKNFQFYDIANTGFVRSELNEAVVLMGFSKELARYVKSKGIAFFTYFLGSRVISLENVYNGFNFNKHFIIEHEHSKNGADPHGLSGTGIWSYNFPVEDKIWSPEIYLVGVQTNVLTKSQNLKATKVEQVIKLFNSIENIKLEET